MRIKSKWHDSQIKSINDIASALSFNAWRLTKNSLEDLINEAFVIEKAQVFDVIAEYLCFIIQCTDRLIFNQLNQKDRKTLITQLVKQLSFYYQENKAERISPGDHWKDFLSLYNQRANDYAKFDFQQTEPNYHFYRYFGQKIQQCTTKADEKWIAQQMIEIQGPKAFKQLKTHLDNTFSQVTTISNQKPKKSPTSREIRRKERRAKKELNHVDANQKIQQVTIQPLH